MKRKEVSVVLCGGAGQGVQTIEELLAPIFKRNGLNVFAFKEYMSRIRGGSNSTELRVSSERVAAYTDRIDILIPFDKKALTHIEERISDSTVIIGEKDKISTERNVIDVPFLKIASEIGGPIYSNIIGVGLISSLFSIDQSLVEEYVEKRFAKKGKEIMQNNLQAVAKGFEIGTQLKKDESLDFEIERNLSVKNDILINGSQAVGMGALAGGCNFLSSYPMTPGTGVLTFLASQTKNFDIIVEQAEDEVSAINMAIGANYAGARAMVTTSGGGFALMVEGVSLAAMHESPVVIHVAQRPGPATGLPTRTEQADLEFVLYSGHGEFPRVIYAPGSVEEAFYLSQKAFDISEKYQIPVFILTDQYLVDSYYNIADIELDRTPVQDYVVQTSSDYKRYQITEDGVSPRGVPGFGDGLVCVDSDEHDEEGHLTERLDLRVQMMNKRLKKFDALKAEALEPELIGDGDYKILVVCWGSNYHIVKEVIEKERKGTVSALHFKQVFPVSDTAKTYFEKADKIVSVENNATGQFARILGIHTGYKVEPKFLKYNGSPFSVEEMERNLSYLGGEYEA